MWMNLFKRIAIILSLMIVFFGGIHLPTVEAASKLPKGSTLAGILIEGMKYEEAKEALEREIVDWQLKQPLIAKTDYEKLSIQRTTFSFDVDASLLALEEQIKDERFLFFFKGKDVHLPLVTVVNNEVIEAIDWADYINQDETLEAVKEVASNLGNSRVETVYEADVSTAQGSIGEVTHSISGLSEVVMEYAVSEIDGQMIHPDDSFSFLDTVVIPDELMDSSKELSFTGTALYELILQTNVKIIERHSHSYLPDYAETGIDAEIDEAKNRDLVVYNDNVYAFTIHAEINAGNLIMSLQTILPNNVYKYEQVNEAEIKQRTIYRYSKELQPGQEKNVEVGREGRTVDIYRADYMDDNFIDRELISQDFYPPVPRVVLISSKDPLPEVDEPSSTEDEDIEEEISKQEDLQSSVENNNLILSCFMKSLLNDSDGDSNMKDSALDCLLQGMGTSEDTVSDNDKENTNTNTNTNNNTSTDTDDLISACVNADLTEEKEVDETNNDQLLECIMDNWGKGISEDPVPTEDDGSKGEDA